MVGKKAEPQETVHFTGRVRLARHPLPPHALEGPVHLVDRRVIAPDIYRVYFHGPAYQVLDSAWRYGDIVIGRFADNLPVGHVPAERPTIVSPRLLELCFQAAGLWDLGIKGQMALPLGIEHVAIFTAAHEAKAPLFAVVRPDDARKAFDADVVDADGHVVLRVRGYRTVEVPSAFEEAVIQPLQAAMAADDGQHPRRMVLAVDVK
jgi:hypothetical protein